MQISAQRERDTHKHRSVCRSLLVHSAVQSAQSGRNAEMSLLQLETHTDTTKEGCFRISWHCLSTEQTLKGSEAERPQMNLKKIKLLCGFSFLFFVNFKLH